MTPPFIAATEIESLVPMSEAIEALREAFSVRQVMDDRAILNLSDEPPLRSFLAMPARSGGASGAKLVTLFEENVANGKPAVQGVYVLFSAQDGRVRAILDGAVLTKIRTPAASALATDCLASPDASRLGLFGTGVQAEAHLEAMLTVRPGLESVEVVSGTAGRAVEFAASMSDRFGVAVTEGEAETAAGADIVCTTTRAWGHLFASEQLNDHTHVNAVGAFLPTMAEFGPDVVARCDVWVDHIDSSKAEAGELIQAADSGSWQWSQVLGDLADLVQNRPPASAAPTLFRNVGLSIEDLIVATRAADNAGIEP